MSFTDTDGKAPTGRWGSTEAGPGRPGTWPTLTLLLGKVGPSGMALVEIIIRYGVGGKRWTEGRHGGIPISPQQRGGELQLFFAMTKRKQELNDFIEK